MNRSNAGGIVLPEPSRAERSIANAATGHCTAFAVLGDGNGIRFQAESHTELLNLLILNASPEVADLREQVLFSYGPKLEDHHYFDALAVHRNGRRIAYTVKPEAHLHRRRKDDPKGLPFLERMQIITWWVRKQRFADDVRLITEADLDPVLVHNAKIIAAVREPDPEADGAAWLQVRHVIGARTLRDLTQSISMDARGYRALLRLIRNGRLRVQAGQRISPSILVTRKEFLQ
ncbi:PDDEXK family nuclease [Paenirhodobacter populi]|uniref:hypothetical protein n=1 Tax=Paenirhodobacter populi TaxID=2306993 RepID=UPI000FE3AF6F|nr:hypothetical protein [Sinirhodobacter populi]RWR04141.1 hypothetical protein D2T32_20565 [Sinirhodobacter populi]